MKNRSIAILFLIITSIIPLVYIGFSVKKAWLKKQIRHEIRAGLPKSKLQLFKIHEKDTQQFEWEHSKEFKINEQFYDVVHRISKNDSIHYWCWKDDKESELALQIAQLADQIYHQNKPSDHHKNDFLDFLKSISHHSIEDPHFDFYPSYQKQSTLVYSNLYQSIFIDKPSPPPNVV